MTTRWEEEATRLASGGDAASAAYRQANANIISRTLNGYGMDSGNRRVGDGVRVVFNASSTHIPGILADGYDNGYQRTARRTIGTSPPPSKRRRFVDEAISEAISSTLDHRVSHDQIHYGAAELNGSGLRYYGDTCIVLKDSEFPAKEVVLSRNSYDLARAPLADRIGGDATLATNEAKALLGSRADIGHMLACKILAFPGMDQRLVTIGRVSAALLHDEDYFEVVRFTRFDISVIEELRVSASDAAVELQIGNQLARGPTPSLEELVWRHRREQARAAAAAVGIPYRIVMSDGRLRA
jgi:hypothetical protein